MEPRRTGNAKQTQVRKLVSELQIADGAFGVGEKIAKAQAESNSGGMTAKKRDTSAQHRIRQKDCFS